MEKTFTLLLLSACIIIQNGFCQTAVCDGDVKLTSQAEVDSFQCTEVTGTLTISGDDITNLSPLQNLTKVGRLFITECNSLVTLDGLSGITRITSRTGIPYTLGIAGNEALKNVDGLSGIVNDSLHSLSISNNPSLESINALSSVETVFGLFSIANNASLKSMNGFRNITSMQESGFSPYLLIDNNPSLTNLDGFSSLQTIVGHGANLDISNNPGLTNIDGLSSLTTIAGGGRPAGLFINNNDALTNIDGLRSLSLLDYAVAGAITISGNEQLQNVDGLENINLPSRNFYLTVTDNPALTKCDGLFPVILDVGIENAAAYSDIRGNGGGCTLEDIINNGPPAVIGLTVFDRRSKEMVRDYGAGDVYLDAAPKGYKHYILRATTNEDKVGSVVFKAGNVTRIDNHAPFEFDFQFLPPGSHTVVTEVYSKPNRKGIKGVTNSKPLTIVNGAAIQSFFVIDTDGNILKYLQNGDEINIKDPAYKSISIGISVYPEEVGHVIFSLNGKRYHTEREAPYTLKGDNQRKINQWRPRPGAYTLRATPFAETASKSYAGASLDVNFTVVDRPLQSVKGLMLVDSNGNVIRQLHNGAKIDLSDSTLSDFQFVAETEGNVGSVVFKRNGKILSTSNDAPYAVQAEHLKSASGVQFITATPYPDVDGRGDPGQSLHVFLRLEKGASIVEFDERIGQVSLFPVPVHDQLNVRLTGGEGQTFQFLLRNNTGQIIYKADYRDGEDKVTISMAEMPSGLYYLEVQGNNYKKVVRFLK